MKQQLAVIIDNQGNVPGKPQPAIPTAIRSQFVGKLDANRVGMALGALLGGWHLLWAVLVAAGWAQAVMDFVFWMHFLNPAWRVGAFQPGIAAILVIVTSTLGYAIGYCLAVLWNWIQK